MKNLNVNKTNWANFDQNLCPITSIRKERKMEGIAKTKEKGVRFGAEPKMFESQGAKIRQRKKIRGKIKDLMQH